MKTERYSTIWQRCSETGRLAERFFVPGYTGYLPFFIWGDDLKTFEERQNIELREEHLLKGILYGMYEFANVSRPWHREEDRDTLMHLLDVLGNGFKFENPEKMILDVAYSMREKNGNSASRVVLEVGNCLIPHSSKIKSDLICDLWGVISECNDEPGLYGEIVDLVEQLDFDEINADAKEVVCYYGFCSMIFLKKNDDEIADYLSRYIYPNVSLRKLKINIKNLLENPEGFSPTELKVN